MNDDHASLRARVEDAIADLATIRHDDPAASDAIQAVRLTVRTLHSFWVPALDRELGGRTGAADGGEP